MIPHTLDALPMGQGSIPLKAPRKGHLRQDPLVGVEVGLLCIHPIAQQEEVPLVALCFLGLETHQRQSVVLCLCEDLLLCSTLLCVKRRAQATSVKELREGQQGRLHCRGPSVSTTRVPRQLCGLLEEHKGHLASWSL